MVRPTTMQAIARGLVCLAVLTMLAANASAAELVMFRRDGCPWCARWDREIGPIYPTTELSRRAPLRMVNLDSDRTHSVSLRSPVIYTPTFVLVEDGREVARLEGYPGEAFFWGLVEQMVARLPAPKHEGTSAPGDRLKVAGVEGGP
jgi:hypothetical protein